MASKHSGQIAWHDFALPTQEATPTVEGLGGRFLDRVRQAFCGLHGHDVLLQFAQDRMFLKCVSCGHESPGWELNEPRPIASGHSDERRQPLAGPHLISARRIA
jgi:hypothetical protein